MFMQRALLACVIFALLTLLAVSADPSPGLLDGLIGGLLGSDGDSNSDDTQNPSAPKNDGTQGERFDMDPLGTSLPRTFKNAKTSIHPIKKMYSSDYAQSPYETNKWWINYVLKYGDELAASNPYLIKAMNTSAAICVPHEISNKSMQISPWANDWVVGSQKKNDIVSRVVSASDDLSVTVDWRNSKGKTTMQSVLVRGMPFTSFNVSGITPNLTSQHKISDIKLSMEKNGIGMAVVKLNQSTWIITSDPPIQWKRSSNHTLVPVSSSSDDDYDEEEDSDDLFSSLLSSIKSTGKGAASKPYTGLIRIAYTGSNPATSIPILKKYIETVPIGGDVQLNPAAPGEAATITFNFKIAVTPSLVNNNTKNNNNLLMYALPHHIDTIQKAQTTTIPGIRATKGPMTGIIGTKWTMTEQINTNSFFGPSKIDPKYRQLLVESLHNDTKSNITTVTHGDPYFYGKDIAKIARLILIAEELDEYKIQRNLTKYLKQVLDPWTKGTNDTPLSFDTTWSGIVSKNGTIDSTVDFGNGIYNDHHFHYGYFTYAAAVVNRIDPEWAEDKQEFFTTLLRDYANPSRRDDKFVFMREFDFYDGHSWTSGVEPAVFGRNQESSSEAINGYYGAYLYALSIGDTQLANFYNLILSMEGRTATMYWHPTNAVSKRIYLPGYNSRNVVGILASSQVTYNTWFGGNEEYIWGIQMLPYTPASHLIIHKDWVRDGSKELLRIAKGAIANKGPSWAHLLYTAYGLVDRDYAVKQVVKLEPDGGNTVTNSLHWIITSNK